MAQADGVVANGTGSAVRADINGQLAALFTNHSGSTEPATTFAFQTWADTNTSTLKLRNSSNDGWIQLARLDGQFDAKTFNGNITLNAQSDLRLADSDSSNWVAFQAPATVASNVTWTLPAADGTSGQTLQTNGSGTLSWSTPSATVDKIEEGNTSAEVVDTGSDGHFKVITEGTEAVRVDSSQRLLVGTHTSTPGAAGDLFEVAGNAPSAIITSTASSRSVDQVCGQLRFYGKAGANEELASIKTLADGTHGSGDKPSRLVFSTTADGASSPTERLRIAQSGAFGLSGANYGTSGQVLTSQGSGSAPQWASVSAGFTRSSQSSLSGNSSVDFTIASGVNYIDVIGYNFGSSADVEIRLQIGDSGGIKTSSYRSGTSNVFSGGSTELHESSLGWVLSTGEDDRTYECHWRIRRMGNGAWSCSWNGMFNGPGNTLAGTVQGSGHYGSAVTLTTVRLTVASGTFDSGSASVLYL